MRTGLDFTQNYLNRMCDEINAEPCISKKIKMMDEAIATSKILIAGNAAGRKESTTLNIIWWFMTLLIAIIAAGLFITLIILPPTV